MPPFLLNALFGFKCRTKREMKNPEKVTLKNKRQATRGTCPHCGTKIFRIGG
jgi:hypothetical protein